MTAIEASGHTARGQPIRDIIQASSAIPGFFASSPTQAFDPVYMKQLFDLGADMILDGRAWILDAKRIRELG